MEENEIVEKTTTDEISECLNCGAKLKENEEFCSKCGMKRGEYNKILCKNCGAELQLRQKFCPKCGAKANTEIGIDGIVNSVKKGYRNKIRKISLKKVITILIIIAILGVIGMIVKDKIAKAFISVNDLLAEGEYLQAYEKAKDDEKEDILDENILAVLSNEMSEGLKNPNSYSLTSAWIDKENKRIVMNTSGTNSYGAVVSAYDYYTYSSDKNKYELFCSLSDLKEETISKYDTTKEFAEKFVKNQAKEVVSQIIDNDDLKVDGKHINNINQLFKSGKLKEITLIQVENV